MDSNQRKIRQNNSHKLYNNSNQNIYFANDNLNQFNLGNNYVDFSNINQKKMSKINEQGIINKNNNIYPNDERLNLCLNYLGLRKYIINFQNNGINFDEFLSLSNKDFSILNIPNKIQNIIQKFIISYLNFGSLYTKDEIIQFFRMKKAKNGNSNNTNLDNRGNNRNQRGNNHLSRHQSVNNNKINMNNQLNKNMNNNQNNNIRRNNYMNYNNRPKSQTNKQINYDLFNNNYMQNNYNPINNQNMNNKNNNTNFNVNNYNNYINNNKKQIKNNNNNNMIKNNNMKIIRKNICNNNINNTSKNNISLSSNANNANYFPPSVDNISHMAVEGNSANIDNLIKMTQFREMNNNNYNNLRQNLNVNSNIKKNINSNNSNNNMNNKKYLNKSASNNIIEQMDNILKRIQLAKGKNGNIMTQSNNNNNNIRDNSVFSVNINKGYHSDGYLNEQKKLMQFNSLINSKNNNIRSNNSIKSNSNTNTNNSKVLNGYEVNTFYTGDTSQFDSMRGENIIGSEIRKIKGKNGRIYYSKENKARKIKEDQKKKIEQLLEYNSSSATPKMPINCSNPLLFNTRGISLKRNNDINMNNYNDDEINSIINNNSKTNLTNYTDIYNNNYINPINMGLNMNINNMNQQKQKNIAKKHRNNNKINRELYSPSNHNHKFIKQKNMLIQGKKHQKNISNNISKNTSNNARIFSNFNTYLNNRGNISNLYDNNYEEKQGIKINSNIMNDNMNKFQNKNNIGNYSNKAPIQIQNRNNNNNNNFFAQNNTPQYNNYINMNSNQKSNERRNNFMNNNNNNRNMNNNLRKNYSVGQNKINNINFQIPNNYINTFINVHNNENYTNQQKRYARSFDGNRNQLNIGVYTGIHNINNNINNININNINYDSMGYSNGFNNIMGLDMGLNFQTQKNFYQPNNILNDENFFDEII